MRRFRCCCCCSSCCCCACRAVGGATRRGPRVAMRVTVTWVCVGKHSSSAARSGTRRCQDEMGTRTKQWVVHQPGRLLEAPGNLRTCGTHSRRTDLYKGNSKTKDIWSKLACMSQDTTARVLNKVSVVLREVEGLFENLARAIAAFRLFNCLDVCLAFASCVSRRLVGASLRLAQK